jgi:hypothetical protein
MKGLLDVGLCERMSLWNLLLQLAFPFANIVVRAIFGKWSSFVVVFLPASALEVVEECKNGNIWLVGASVEIMKEFVSYLILS